MSDAQKPSQRVGSRASDARRSTPPAPPSDAADAVDESLSDASSASHRVPATIKRIARLAKWTERRMRFGRAFHAGTTALALALFGLAVLLAFAKTGKVITNRAVQVGILYALVAMPFVVAIVAWFRRLAPMAGAIALDKQAGLHDRLATALAFSKVKNPTPFQKAAIEDALAHANAVKPSLAVPFVFPPDLLAVVGMAGVVGVLWMMEVHKKHQTAHAPTINALEMNPDDIEALEDFGRQMEDHAHTPEMQAVVQEFNQLVEDLKNKHIDRNEAFKRMADLDLKLQTQNELDKKALEEAMKKLGDELKKNDLTKDVGEALTKGDKKEAEKKLKELSEKLKKNELKLTDEQKKALAEALKKASQRDREKALAEMKAKREKLEAELEKLRAEKEKNGGKETPEMEKERKEKEKELERLDRDEKEQESADRQLEKLDRDLASAAEDILKDLGLSANDLDAGAEDINRMAEDDMTDEEKEELRQRLKEMHDLLVQQGKLTPEQIAKLKEFMKKAKGGKSGKSKKKKKGKLGEFDPNADPSAGGDDQGDDQDSGDGDDPNGDGQKWTIGPGGEKIPMPGAGQGGGQSGDGQGNQPGGNGEQPGGSSWGTGHDPKMLGKKTNNKVGTQDIQVAGANAGPGPNNAKTILGAADKGFVGSDYKKVYDSYKTVAEQALKTDEIPAGYRFYVRRYFDLIRPRE